MANPFVHLELNTPDLAKAKDFYAQLLGWKFEDMDMGPAGTYSTFKPDNGPGGGIMSMPAAPTAWLAYVGVEDIHTATDKARSLGAQVIREAQEVPGHGVFSIVIDPTGASIALWQAKSA
ncbi:VOC family protein [Granulicella sp. dw_53]|uniref:VOC family protein n=1 Tax=Granulicella sp. dw_53 TaxID=2719792 RepID=UPI001BD340CC|nr:VOC family protein [Granulicella sp. dw_53]